MRRPLAASTSLLSSRLSWLRLAAAVALLWWSAGLIQNPASWTALLAQETNPTLEDVAPPGVAVPASVPAKSSAKQRTLINTIVDGGYIGVIIILLSMVAVGFIVEHALTIRKQRIMPDAVLDPLEELIAKGDYQGAIQYCQDPAHYCLATDVVLAGLERYTGSEFGFAEYKAAVEEAGEDNTARLYRKTDVLSVIGAIAPMLGLFGTVEGMIGAFNTIAGTEGAAQPAALAGDIGKALITTWLGLLVAIPAMIGFSYFRNKIDSLVSECGKRVERMLAPLSRKK